MVELYVINILLGLLKAGLEGLAIGAGIGIGYKKGRR